MHQTERHAFVLVVIHVLKSLQDSHNLSHDDLVCWLVRTKRLDYLYLPLTLSDVDDTL